MSLIYVLNGPNLNLLGKREPELYGTATLEDVETACKAVGSEIGFDVVQLQSNYEGQIVDWVHDAREKAAAIVINPAALTHTSVAVLDALNMFDGPVVEVHISQIHKRESFRHHSYVSHRADAVIVGCGVHGYELAVRHVGNLLKQG